VKIGYITDQIRKAIIVCLKEDRCGELQEDDNIESTVKTIEEIFMGMEQ